MKELTKNTGQNRVYRFQFKRNWKFWEKPSLNDKTINTRFFKLSWDGGLRFTLILPQVEDKEPKILTDKK